MLATAVALAFGAAVLHAGWNLLLARAADPRAATAVAVTVATVVLAPVALLGGDVETEAWPWIAASAALETAYLLLLARAYAAGELSAVYPIARGSAPVLLALAGAAGVGGALSALQVAGALVLGASVIAIGAEAAPDGARPAGVALALAVALCIAGYTLVDREGVRHASALTYLWLVLAPAAAVTLAVTARERGRAALRAALSATAVVAGLATFAAYLLVLLALRHAPAGVVAAVRETSVVLAVAAGALVLRERVTRRRWLAALALAAGATLVAAG